MSEEDKFIHDLERIMALDLTPELAYVIGRMQNIGWIEGQLEDLGLLLNLLRGIISEYRNSDIPREIQLEVMLDIYRKNFGQAIKKIKSAKMGQTTIELDQTVNLLSRNEKKLQEPRSTINKVRDQTTESRDDCSYLPTELAKTASYSTEPLNSPPTDLPIFYAHVPHIQLRRSITPIPAFNRNKSPTDTISPIRIPQRRSQLNKPYESKATGLTNLPISPALPNPPSQALISQLSGISQIPTSKNASVQAKCKLCELDLSKESTYETKICNHKFHTTCIQNHKSSLPFPDLICPYPNCTQSLSSDFTYIKSQIPCPQNPISPVAARIHIINLPRNISQVPSDQTVSAPNIKNAFNASSKSVFIQSPDNSCIKCNACQRLCQLTNEVFYNCAYCAASYCGKCKNRYLSNHKCPIVPSSSEPSCNFRTVDNRLLCSLCSVDVLTCRCSSDQLKNMR